MYWDKLKENAYVGFKVVFHSSLRPISSYGSMLTPIRACTFSWDLPYTLSFCFMFPAVKIFTEPTRVGCLLRGALLSERSFQESIKLCTRTNLSS